MFGTSRYVSIDRFGKAEDRRLARRDADRLHHPAPAAIHFVLDFENRLRSVYSLGALLHILEVPPDTGSSSVSASAEEAQPATIEAAAVTNCLFLATNLSWSG
jgi:hypothetical protein